MEAEQIVLRDLKEYQKEDRFDPQTEFMKVWLKYSSVNLLCDAINERVYGQEESVKKSALLIYYYLKSLATKGKISNRLNHLIVGESGCGKTTFAKALREILYPIPILTANCAGISQVGFNGSNPSDILDSSNELRRFGFGGICFLDEIDKMMRPKYAGQGENVSLAVMDDFLKMLDGDTILTRDGTEINCNRILFIGLGAFTDVRGQEEDISHIGFGSRTEHIDKKIVDRDAITSFCHSEQLMGRFVTVLQFKKPSYSVYHKIALEAVYEIAKVYGRSETRQVMDNIDKIVHDSIESEYGCRNIRNAVWEYFLTHNDICA